MINKTEQEIMRNWKTKYGRSPQVSIRTLAYNHEAFIEEALDSFLEQETEFPFEIVVHDDASTDKTATIIKQYEEKYPTIVKPIYEKENIYSKPGGELAKIMDRACQGKYIAYCEGDDFFTDAHKLQMQFDIMEKYPEVTLCTHTVRMFFDDNKSKGKTFPAKHMETKKICLQEYLDRSGYVFQTSSFFIRKRDLLRYREEQPEFKKAVTHVGDRPLCMYLLTKGDAFYIDREMSCYRRFAQRSWSSRTYGNKKKRIKYYYDLAKMMELFDKYTGHLYDCHIDRYRWKYYVISEQFQELLKPEFEEILNGKSAIKRMIIKGCARLPIMGTVALKIINIKK